MKSNSSSLGGRSQVTRFVAGIATVALGALVLIGSATSASSAVEDQLDSHVMVEQTSKNAVGECAPGVFGLTYNVMSNEDVFQLTVNSNSDPCSPITAHAVVYGMPGGGQGPWPQTLLEKETFTISEAGTTVITFSKDCSPMQFDVLTGATPEVISPDGAFHGPLLFPFDTETAFQYFGDPGCAEVSPSTTTQETTTTTEETTTTSTTTTEPADVLGTSTTAPDDSGAGSSATLVPNAPTETTAVVQGAQETRALAVTGASNTEMTLIGAGLLLAGMGLIVTSRKRLA